PAARPGARRRARRPRPTPRTVRMRRSKRREGAAWARVAGRVGIADAWCQRAGREGGSAREGMEAAMAVAAATVVLGQGARGVSAPVFVESAAATGLRFTHVNGASGEFFLPEQMGAGVALFDYDNDGDLDVFLVQGASMTASGGAARPSSRLFRNDLVAGAGGRSPPRFTDASARAGAG